MVSAPIARPQPPYYGYGRVPPTISGRPPVGADHGRRAGPAKVALLVPLSGANAELGKAILDAAQLALFKTGGDRLILVPRDTGGNAAGAAGAARAVVGDGARLILGPLLAPEVEAVKPVAQEAPRKRHRLLDGNQPRRRQCLFDGLPAAAGGRARGQLCARTRARPFRRARAQLALRASDGRRPAGSRNGDGRQRDKGRILRPAGRRRLACNPAPAARRRCRGQRPSRLPYRRRLPPSTRCCCRKAAPSSRQIAAQVRAAGGNAKPVQLLGSGLWDTPDIGGDPALVGGWFASSPPEARQEFERRFNATYGHNPPRLASLGFDAAALAAVLAGGQAGEPFSQQAILNPSGFTGVDGLFRFTPQWSRAARPRGARSRAPRHNRRQPRAAELSGCWLLSFV